jgi:hypothetical protein
MGFISFNPAAAYALNDLPRNNVPFVVPNPYADENEYYHHPITLKSISSATSQQQYDVILDGMLNLRDEVMIPDYSGDSEAPIDIMYQVLDEHPEIFYFQAQGSVLWSNGRFELKYKYSKDQIRAMQSRLSNKVSEILKENIRTGSSSLAKELAIHDYLISHVKYDIDNYNHGTIPELDYTAYGCLINGTCVCDGYSKAMQLLLTEAGIECRRITGNAGDGSHAWNMVKLDGQWYHVDVTWDDPVPDTSALRYTYFNQPDSVMSKDHSWTTSAYPAASSTQYVFFNTMVNATHDDEYIYYTNSADDKIYRMRLDGTGRTCLDVKGYYPVLDGEWLYFSNYGNGGYIFKVKTDGSDLTQVNSFYTVKIYRLGRNLYYTNQETGQEMSLELSPYLEIVNLEILDAIEVNAGTPFADLPLPAMLTVTLNDGSTDLCYIDWNDSGYDPNPAVSSNYLISGEIVLPDDIYNPNNMQANIIVKVTVSQPQETWTDLPAKEKPYFDYWTIVFNKEVDPDT